MKKPEIVIAIEAVLGKTLAQSPSTHQLDPLRTLMAIQKTMPHKYLLDEEGQLIGLNLSSAELTDQQWHDIVGILNQASIGLHALNLSDNQLQDFLLPVSVEKLRMLDVSENRLTVIKLDIDRMNALQEIYVSENPLTAPPPEVVQQGSKAVLAWFASFKKETGATAVNLHEIKIMLVGEGLAGKTSLLKKIKGLPFNDHENQTHGVNVEMLDMGSLPMFSAYSHLRDVKARIWDFGGQEIMHASHQFFLTHRSIYVFVLDSRTDNKKGYWLRHIQKFGGASPTIVAINKIDDNKNYSLEEATLNKNYPFVGNRFIKISCKTDEGLDQFARILAELIPTTELFNTPISSNWLQVKNTLERDTAQKKYINRERFLEICNEHAVDDEAAQDALLNYLHALGVVLHFKELSLQQFYILDPHWATIGVYKIINSPSIVDGILEEQKLDFILNKEEQKTEEYDPSKEKVIEYCQSEQLYLISIMEEFELLYKFDKGRYLVPDLLPKELAQEIPMDTDQAVTFIMEYDFLPPNLMTRFIISMKDDIHDVNKLWRHGVLLTSPDRSCTALVTADSERQRVTIYVNGQERRKREYFAVIYHKLCTINNKFEGLQVTEKMPVPEHPDIEVDYADLLGLEEMDEDNYTIGKLKKRFSVSRDFLDKISSKEQREQKKNAGDVNINVNIDHRDITDALDSLKQDTQAIRSHQQDQQRYLNALVTFAAQSYQRDMPTYFQRIDASDITDQELIRIDAELEQQLDRVFARLPASEKIVQGWNDAKTKAPSQVDIKTRLKIKIPFVFGEFEQEFNADTRTLVKPMVEPLRKAWKAVKDGKNTLQQLFRDDA